MITYLYTKFYLLPLHAIIIYLKLLIKMHNAKKKYYYNIKLVLVQ